MPVRSDKPCARSLILRAHGFRRLPADDGLAPVLADYDRVLERGFGLAFYLDEDRYAVRTYGGPEPVIGARTPPDEAGPWRLVGAYKGSRLFGRGWRKNVRGMPEGTVLAASIRTAEGLKERALFVQGDQLMLHTIHETGVPESVPMLSSTGRTLRASAFPRGDWELGFLMAASVDIECDHPDEVRDHIRLVGPHADTSESVYEELKPLDLRINGVRHGLAELESKRILLPLDGPHPKAIETLAVATCSEGPEGELRREIAVVRPGVLASWTYSADPSRRTMRFRACRSINPEVFSSDDVASWPLLPLVVDGLIGGRAGRREAELQGYEDADARWLGNAKSFLPILRRRLPDGSPLARRIDEHVALSGLPVLLEARIGSKEGEEPFCRTVHLTREGGALVRLADGSLLPVPTSDPAEILAACPDVLTVPASEPIFITTRVPSLVADHLILTGDLPDETDCDLGDAEAGALCGFSDLKPVSLRINNVPYLVTWFDGRWTPVPIEGDAPRTTRDYATLSCGYEDNLPDDRTVGTLRPGLTISWKRMDDGGDSRVRLSTGDPLKFTVEETAGWPVINAMLGRYLDLEGPEEDHYGRELEHLEGSWHFSLEPEELPRFFALVAERLGDYSSLRPHVDAYLRFVADGGPALLSGLDTLLQIRIGSLESDTPTRRTIHRSPEGGALVRLADGSLRSLPTTDLAEILAVRPDLLTVPAGKTVSITTDAPDFVADHLTLTGDLPKALDDEELGDPDVYEALEQALSRYSSLRPLHLTINDVPYLAAPLDGAWTVLPIDASDPYESRFLLSRELAAATYSFLGGGISDGSYYDYIGVIRPGLAVSYSAYDGDGCPFALSAGDPLEFTARQIQDWPFFPAVLDPFLGTRTTTDSYGQSLDEHYDGSGGLDLTDEETPRFLKALAASLDDSSELRTTIESQLKADR
ncbi:hypothetical protein ABGB12_26030 [Actinocorallia sp. B10E7]|uniref:hypothetical protein n=1 Tax=Actinocorallia sp. B10E7 TaxID=3153558 RepID=UPI00325EE08C